MDNSWAGPTSPQIFVPAPSLPCEEETSQASPSRPLIRARQASATGNSAGRSYRDKEAQASERSDREREEEDGGPGWWRRGASDEARGRAAGGGGGQRRRAGRGGGARASAAPPRASRKPVHLHPRQAHQGARPPRVVAGAELRPAAEVQAVRRALRRAGRGARDREPARRQRQDRPPGHHQHRAARAARRRRAPPQRQVRRRRPPPPELLIHHHRPPGDHRREARNAGDRVLRGGRAGGQHKGRDLLLRGGRDQVQPHVPRRGIRAASGSVIYISARLMNDAPHWHNGGANRRESKQQLRRPTGQSHLFETER